MSEWLQPAVEILSHPQENAMVILAGYWLTCELLNIPREAWNAGALALGLNYHDETHRMRDVKIVEGFINPPPLFLNPITHSVAKRFLHNPNRLR